MRLRSEQNPEVVPAAQQRSRFESFTRPERASHGYGNRWSVSATPAAVAFARKRVVAQILFWGLYLDRETVEGLELLVSELVTNAIEHGACDQFAVAVGATPGSVYVSVTDSSPDEPEVRRSPDDDEPSGRGMFLVDFIANSWGVSPAGNGKEVWFTLDLPAPDPPFTAVASPPRPQPAVYAATPRVS